MKTILLQFVSACILFWLFTGCKDNYISSIPNYPVYLELNLTASYPTFKDNPYQYLTFTKARFDYEAVGFGGILVFCGLGNQSSHFEYFAFDMACPHEAQADVKVKPNDQGQATCEKCGTVYDISFGIGNPIKGPSKEALKPYKTSLKSKPFGDFLYIFR